MKDGKPRARNRALKWEVWRLLMLVWEAGACRTKPPFRLWSRVIFYSIVFIRHHTEIQLIRTIKHALMGTQRDRKSVYQNYASFKSFWDQMTNTCIKYQENSNLIQLFGTNIEWNTNFDQQIVWDQKFADENTWNPYSNGSIDGGFFSTASATPFSVAASFIEPYDSNH